MISVFDKLIEMDVNGNYVPYLAESLTSNEDFTVWTMTLRGDVTFHNGVELTAQSIADMFPIQQAGAAGSMQSLPHWVVEATGDLEVTYTLSEGGQLSRPRFLVRQLDSYSNQPQQRRLRGLLNGPSWYWSVCN